MALTLEDQERAFYIRNGIDEYTTYATPVMKMLIDMEKEFYLDNITLPVTPTPQEKEMATEDLEVIWLKEESGITDTSSSEDLWFRWQSPVYGTDRTVDDLKYNYYRDN